MKLENGTNPGFSNMLKANWKKVKIQNLFLSETIIIDTQGIFRYFLTG